MTDYCSDNAEPEVKQDDGPLRSKLRDLYRKCIRTKALSKGEIELRLCIEQSIGPAFTLVETKINSFRDIEGYRLDINGKSAFFPAESLIDGDSGGLSWLRETFLAVDLVLPPFWTMQTLHNIANEIHRDADRSRREKLTGFTLSHLYSPASLAALCSAQYSQRPAVAPHYEHVLESLKAYFLGLYGAAITTLIPCLEAAMRAIGDQIGYSIAGRIDRSSFLKVLNKLQLHDITNIIFNGYDWFPEEVFNVAYFDQFNERIQMIGSVKYFIEHAMYQNTDEYGGTTGLNRHGIIHGLISGFDTPVNYLRLVTLLNSLCIASMIAGDAGSFFHPSESTESKRLAEKFVECQKASQLIRG